VRRIDRTKKRFLSAAAVCVSGANTTCATVSGWIEVGDTNYSHPYRLCMPGFD
jgi:hypothetical protein